MKKRWIGFISLLGILGILYVSGPTPPEGNLNGHLPMVTSNLGRLDNEINTAEKANPLIKPDNQARIIWADSTHKKTAYSMVYLHGFGASQGEGAPIHTRLAKRYGCNLYLARLKEQGIESDSAFKSMTVENYLESAKKAVAIGKALGDKVIILSTSTGGALGLFIASQNPDIAGLVLYSPIIAARNSKLKILSLPWGVPLMESLVGSDHLVENREGLDQQYWSDIYYIEGYSSLSMLVEHTMNEKTFRHVKCPVFLGYYYKNEEEQDDVVSVPAMLDMYAELGTPDSLKEKKAFPNAGNHVIGSYIRSGAWQEVMQTTDQFLSGVMHLSPVDTLDTTMVPPPLSLSELP